MADEIEIRPSARKHGVADDDIRHAVEHHTYTAEVEPGDALVRRVMYLGPDRSANFLEVIAVARDDGTEIVVHAMKMRKVFAATRWSTMTKKKTYGTSQSIELTDELLDKLAAEAEKGYDLSQLRPRRGRPPMGAGPAYVFQVRLEPELFFALRKRAEHEGKTPSDVARNILRAQLSPSRNAKSSRASAKDKQAKNRQP